MELRPAQVVTTEELAELGCALRRSGHRIVWTNGCYDLFHAGHANSLKNARGFGDILVVGVNSDDSVARLKGLGRPILPSDDRVQLLASLSAVNYVVVFDDDTPEVCLDRLKPDVHCKGADYQPPNGKPIPEAALVARNGGRVEYLPLVAGLSTSDIIARIQRLPQAAHGPRE